MPFNRDVLGIVQFAQCILGSYQIYEEGQRISGFEKGDIVPGDSLSLLVTNLAYDTKNPID